jgi:hypothetical protein
MTLAPNEFIRRFLIHVRPRGFYRIRHYGILAKSSYAENLVRARELLAMPKPQCKLDDGSSEPTHRCPCRGGRMKIIEVFERGYRPHYQPSATTVDIRCDTS